MSLIELLPSFYPLSSDLFDLFHLVFRSVKGFSDAAPADNSADFPESAVSPYPF